MAATYRARIISKRWHAPIHEAAKCVTEVHSAVDDVTSSAIAYFACSSCAYGVCTAEPLNPVITQPLVTDHPNQTTVDSLMRRDTAILTR